MRRASSHAHIIRPCMLSWFVPLVFISPGLRRGYRDLPPFNFWIVSCGDNAASTNTCMPADIKDRAQGGITQTVGRHIPQCQMTLIRVPRTAASRNLRVASAMRRGIGDK